ncbi:MAG TPA: hypothetical protein PKN99_00040 [Cyclobacteriaceae bacterium]|nr:hypothetical protein [Cyclobacteriaceae bacterium]HNP05977.1 hypothetical protein [Cyclobacteriaceae bacterium]HRK54967.1 hypothetical protein [Cyclobacteriaceae bacterium]
MKKVVGIFLVVMLFLGACATPKPYYETSKGKKKLKHYNKLQFGQENKR